MNDNRIHPGPDNGQKPTAKRFPQGRVIRVFLITLASLLLLLVLSVSILLWVVFTPGRLTPLVQDQLIRHSPYQASIERVELTFFSTFPRFSIHIDHPLVISPFSGAPSDTLFNARSLAGTIDIRALWKEQEIILNKLEVRSGYVNLFTDTLGFSNYALLMTASGEETAEQAEMHFQLIHMQDISFHDTDVSFVDLMAGVQTRINGVHASLSGTFNGNVFDGTMAVEESEVSFSYADQGYLDHGIVRMDVPVRLDISQFQADFYDAFFSVNGLGVILSGAIGLHAELGSLSTDIHYAGQGWVIDDLLALIPPDYLAPLGAFTAGGKLLASGMIRGLLSDTLFPVIDANLGIEEGDLTHEWIPVPLSGISGDAYLFLDMNAPASAYLDIAQLTAASPASQLQTRGRIDDLLGDIRLDLTTDADMLVEEFSDYFPSDILLEARGRANGWLQTRFSLSDAMALKLENMLLKGDVMLSDFNMHYDTISLWADRSMVGFSLPNVNAEQDQTGFARLEITADTLHLTMNESMTGAIGNARFVVEMSDVRDTTAIPHMHGTYDMSVFSARADTIEVSITQPSGLFTLAPGQDFPKQLVFYMEYKSDRLDAMAGHDLAEAGDTWIISSIMNETSQDDEHIRWSATGFLNMRDGLVRLADIAYPFEIPVVRMDFEPELFMIHESKLRIDQSDFNLSGVVNNVLPYIRGDSLLRGRFLFSSDHTDLSQLMSLTSGIGSEEEASFEPSNDTGQGAGQHAEETFNVDDAAPAAGLPAGKGEGSFSGPYMVPKGMDLSLEAKVKQAAFGPDTISDIRGEVRVSDGVLVLDGIDFSTPAADMRITAMYRTPRKNHLYLGFDYHMFDIDIERLLQMIPDIDTLMPMLRSFRGNGEYHLAIETYLDSLYNIKKSTLRGASSIRGKDLVLLDGETFSEIAKTLRFSKKAENRVDSLAAEFTIFREEIDVYPFLIVMDRYQAVVAGRHNFDMSFNYHISLVDSPLPVRLGIDITGNLDKMNYRLASPQYAELYRPASRRAVESRQLEFRRMIREALMRNISQE